jgi:phage terminase large subunit-like protein
MVAIDPAETVSETSDETGIVVGGLSSDGEVFVLEDRSGKVAGLDAAFRIWQAWIDHGCEAVIIEGTSLWMLDTLTLAWQALQDEGLVPPGDPPVKTAQPFASKQMRAAPVAAVYEKIATRDETRVHHVGQKFGKLEEQMITWTPEEGDSPDRLDALVYLVSELFGTIPKQATAASASSVGVSPQIRARRPMPKWRGAGRRS